jgi:hypothetical protein
MWRDEAVFSHLIEPIISSSRCSSVRREREREKKNSVPPGLGSGDENIWMGPLAVRASIGVAITPVTESREKEKFSFLKLTARN